MMRASMTSISVRSRRLRSDSQQQQKGGDDMLHFGDIYYADLSQVQNGMHIQSGRRPVIVVSNDACNYYSSVITIVPLTSQLKKLSMPTHVMIQGNGLEVPSMALCEQIMTIDKRLLSDKIGTIDSSKTLNKIRRALMVQIDLVEYNNLFTKGFRKKYIYSMKNVRKVEIQKEYSLTDQGYLWLERILACNNSNGTKVNWCRKNGISYKTFMNRQAQFRQLGLI